MIPGSEDDKVAVKIKAAPGFALKSVVLYSKTEPEIKKKVNSMEDISQQVSSLEKLCIEIELEAN